MKKKLLLVFLGICLNLCSCTSVPVGTMLRMSRFGPKQFAALDPNQIQMKVQVPADVVIVPEKTFFAVTLSLTEPVQEQNTYRFPMTLIRRQHETIGWLNKEHKTNFILRMTQEGVADFVRLQEKLQKQLGGGHGSIAISAASNFHKKDDPSAVPESVQFSIFLKLAQNEDFITLIDNATLSFKSLKDKEPNQISQPEVVK